MKKVFLIPFLFFTIFYIKIPFISNSLILVFLLSLLFLEVGYFRLFKALINTRLFIAVNVTYCLLLIIAIYYPMILGTYDKSLFIVLLKNYIYMGVAFHLSIVFQIKNKNKIPMNDIMIIIFIIQAVIMFSGFFNSTIHNFVQMFQNEMPDFLINDIVQDRRLALSLQQHFGLAVTYCMFFLLSAFEFKAVKYKKITLFGYLFVFVSAITIARTTFIGIAFFMIVLALYLTNRKVAKSIITVVVIAFPVFYFLFFVLNASFVIDKVDYLLRWSFEFLYTESGGTASTNRLMDMYSGSNNLIDFFGYGNYTNSDGSYFGHVDSGYLRLIYFCGVFSVFFYIPSFLLIYYLGKSYKKLGYKMCAIFSFLLYALILGLQVKGEVVTYHTGMNVLLIFYIINNYVRLNPHGSNSN